MAKTTSLRKTTETPVPAAGDKRSRPGSTPTVLVQRLVRARSANEITNVIGLKPIKGRSGPKIAY